MINHADIENIIGCKTLVTGRMQRAIEDWYDAAINGLPLDKNPETLTLDLPALICAELARLTMLELEATVEGSDRADWINAQLQRVLTPRRRRIFTVALALGSGIWKPYQSGKKLGISFCNASRYFPVAHDVEGSLTEGVFIDSIQDDDNYYHRSGCTCWKAAQTCGMKSWRSWKITTLQRPHSSPASRWSIWPSAAQHRTVSAARRI